MKEDLEKHRDGKGNCQAEADQAYWQASLRVVCGLLGAWFLVSLGAGILFRDWLDASFPRVGAAPFGFWMAQQGAIIGFIMILLVYKIWMSRLDEKFAGEEEGE